MPNLYGEKQMPKYNLYEVLTSNDCRYKVIAKSITDAIALVEEQCNYDVCGAGLKSSQLIFDSSFDVLKE